MKEKHSCNALKVLKIIRIILSIILLSYTLSLCIIGHCADEQYYFPMEQNKNLHFSGAIPLIENHFDSVNNFIFVSYVSSNWGNGTDSFVICYYPKTLGVSLYGEIYSNAREFGLYKTGSHDLQYASFDIYWYQGNTPYIQNVNTITPTNFLSRIFVSSSYSSDADYVSNFQLYTNNTSTRKIVLLYTGEEPTLPENDTATENMEKPEINNYIPNWTNKPTFDNSSVENALQSVYNGVIWIGDNIKGTITGTGEYISDTVRWSIQKVINTIRETIQVVQNKIDDVKNAILTVVDKIEDTFDYISQPFDSTKINTAFNNMAIKSDYNNMTTLVNNAVSVFDSTAEPNTFRIPVHLENIPILHINEVQYIDLGWMYDSRAIIRAFMWCVTTFSLLYTIIDALPSYLQGNDE